MSFQMFKDYFLGNNIMKAADYNFLHCEIHVTGGTMYIHSSDSFGP